MPQIVWFGTSALVSVQMEMSTTDPGTEVFASPVTGWVVAMGDEFHSGLRPHLERSSVTFFDASAPTGVINTLSGDCLRSTLTYSGSFASADWNVYFAVQAQTGAGQGGRMRCRLLRGTTPNGAGATEITIAQQLGTEVSGLLGATKVSTATFNPGSFSVSNEYIFIQIAWERTLAGSMSTSDVDVRVGNASGSGTRVISPDFTPAPPSKTWFATSSLVSVQQEMSTIDPGTEVFASPTTGWRVATGNGNHSAFRPNAEQPSFSFSSTTPPDGSIDITNGDCLRSTKTYSGTFFSGNWLLHFSVNSTFAGGQAGRIRCRLFRGASANGAGATEITVGQLLGSITAVDIFLPGVSTATFNPGTFSVADEYIFLQLAWERTSAGTMSNCNVDMRVGNANGNGTRVITSSFSPKLVASPGSIAITGTDAALFKGTYVPLDPKHQDHILRISDVPGPGTKEREPDDFYGRKHVTTVDAKQAPRPRSKPPALGPYVSIDHDEHSFFNRRRRPR